MVAAYPPLIQRYRQSNLATQCLVIINTETIVISTGGETPTHGVGRGDAPIDASSYVRIAERKARWVGVAGDAEVPDACYAEAGFYGVAIVQSDITAELRAKTQFTQRDALFGDDIGQTVDICLLRLVKVGDFQRWGDGYVFDVERPADLARCEPAFGFKTVNISTKR